jgi:hypothetical protein
MTATEGGANVDSRVVLDVLERHVKETKDAYYRGVRGVTYEDMAGAASRLLTMRAAFERAAGRRVASAPTQAQVSRLLRSI